MDFLTVEAIRLNGERIPFKDNLQDVIRALEEDGCLILKHATDLSVIEPELKVGDSTPVHRNIILNKTVKAILFTAREGNYRIASYIPRHHKDEDVMYGRDPEWRKMIATGGLVGVSCIHLGRTDGASWIIKVDVGSREQDKENWVTIEANEGDIFICNHWVRRSTPSLAKRPLEEVYYAVVSYLWEGFSERGKIYPASMGEKIMSIAGTECTALADYVIWQRLEE